MKIKTAVVNGAEISAEAVEFELERLVRFYSAHGASAEEVRGCLGLLREKALEQAIGAKLLLDRSAELDIPVTAADVDAEVERVVAQIGGREAYLAALKAQGVSEDGFRRELEKGHAAMRTRRRTARWWTRTTRSGTCCGTRRAARRWTRS